MRLDYARKNNQRNARGYLLVAVVVLVLVFYGLWPIINEIGRSSTVYTEIDINTGRIRQVRHMFRFDLDEHVQDTVISKAMRLPIGNNLPARWLTVSPGDYAFGYAKYQIDDLADMWRATPFTPEAKRAVAANVLHVWQETRNLDRVTRYIAAVDEAAGVVSRDSSRPIDVADLPPNPGEPPMRN